MTNLTLRRVATSVHLRKAALDRVAQVSSVNLSQNGYTRKRSKESLTLLIRYDSVGTPQGEEDTYDPMYTHAYARSHVKTQMLQHCVIVQNARMKRR